MHVTTDITDYFGTITITAGITTSPFTMDIIDDNIVECIQRFNITIVSANICGIIVGNDSNSKVIIIDDDGVLQ